MLLKKKIFIDNERIYLIIRIRLLIHFNTNRSKNFHFTLENSAKKNNKLSHFNVSIDTFKITGRETYIFIINVTNLFKK